MKFIKLTQGKVAVVDDADYDILKWISWFSKRNGRTWYAAAHMPGFKYPKKQIPMHRYILSAARGQEVDHRNGDGLDNRRSNLRLATRAENAKNRKTGKNNTSGFKGVTKAQHSVGLWKAYIKINKKNFHLGYFVSAREAAIAYNDAAKNLHGHFARLNKI